MHQDGQLDTSFSNAGFATITTNASAGTAIHDLLQTNDGSLVAFANIADGLGTALIWVSATGGSATDSSRFDVRRP